MAEYIDREAVALKVRRYAMPNVYIDGTVTTEDAERYFLKLLEEAPAADVVEVVRCKDCRHYVDAHADGSMYCMRLIRAEDYCETGYIYPLEVPVTDHCFCSYGERRKENG